MRFLKFSLFFAFWFLLSDVSIARPNESFLDSMLYAHSIGIKSGRYTCESAERVVSEAWMAPEGGWSFDEAKKLSNLMMKSTSYSKISKLRENFIALAYTKGGTLGATLLVLNNNRVVMIQGFAKDWSDETSYIEFRYKIDGEVIFVNDKVLITNRMYNKLEIGMSRNDTLLVLGFDEGEQISDSQFGDFKTTSYKYDNIFSNSFIILTFQNEKLISKNQSSF